MVLVSRAAAQQPLESVRSWKCQFPTLATNDWQSDESAPRIKKQIFSFNIDNVNVDAGTARVIGNTGASDLTVVRGTGVLHFLETTPAGNLIVTTIFQAVTKSGRFKAVHSR